MGTKDKKIDIIRKSETVKLLCEVDGKRIEIDLDNNIKYMILGRLVASK